MASKIMFVNQPVSREKRYGDQSKLGNNTPPLTLCLLAALTRKHGYQTVILDAATLLLSMEEAVNRIVKENPRYLGLYGTTLTIEDAARLASLAKEQLENLIVIVGGVHFTYEPEETMNRFSSFDIGVVGEGDVAMLDMLHALEHNQDLSKVRGLIFREGAKLVRTDSQETVHNLDTLPMPAFDLLEDFPHAYLPPFFGFSTLPIATAVVSRGCPAQCKFCRSGIFGDRNLRQYSPKYIVELMRYVKIRFGVEQILFYDDDFVMFRKHTRELCERIIEANLGMTWSCNTRVVDVDPETLALMKRAGCWQISYGIESGSQRVLTFMKKGVTLDLIRRALTWTKEAGIRTNGYFLFGFPTETVEEMEQTIAFSKSLGLDILQCTLFTPFPSLPFSKEVTKYGELQSSDWSEMNIFTPVFVSEGLSPEILERYKRKAWREFYFRPRVQLNLIRMVLGNPMMIGHYLKTALQFVRFVVLPRQKAVQKSDPISA